MKVLYDYQMFSGQKYGGISRYFCELIKQFAGDDQIDASINIKFSENEYLKNDLGIKTYDLPYKYKGRGRNKLISIADQFNKKLTKSEIIYGNYDIFHPTYYDPYFLKVARNTPYIITVYDMIHEKFTEYYSLRDKTTENKEVLIKNATKVIAISENTKRDIVNIFGTSPDKIDVVYLGSSLNNQNSADMPYLPDKYILYVGNRGAYKNFDLLIDSVAETLLEDKSLYLVCCGGGGFNTSEIRKFSDKNIADKIVNIQGSDNELKTLYKNAIALVFPSLYEGFGIPIVEAMSNGCPVVLSNTSSMPEVGGDAAKYFNPNSKKELKDSVFDVVYNDKLRSELIRKGYYQSNKFTWELTAKNTLEVYRSIL